MKYSNLMYYLFNDHLESPVVTRYQLGNVYRNGYYSFGEDRYTTSYTPYQFTVQRKESVIGLYDYHARFYDPSIGRFVLRSTPRPQVEGDADTIVPGPGSPQSWDRYAYVKNNPINNTDPSGHVIAKGCSDPISCGAFSNIYQAADYIYHKSVSDADFLVNLYTTNYLPGETAKERTNVIFDLTYSGPYQHFGGKYGDFGFKEELQDGMDQIGHFFTGVRLGTRKQQSFVPDYVFESLVIGHEMISDNVFDWGSGNLDPNSSLQLIVGATHPRVHRLFNNGEYEEITKYYNFIDPIGYGNSIADLKLTKLAFEFSTLIVDINTTNFEAAEWLQYNLCK